MSKPFPFWTWNKRSPQFSVKRTRPSKLQRLQRRWAVGGTFAVKTLRALTLPPKTQPSVEIVKLFRFRKNIQWYAKLTTGQIVRVNNIKA